MSLNDTPSGERKHIAFFGCRNAGKSSLLNAVTGQQMAIVSDVKGTTTDPVSKAMELLPAGPVIITDTPGLDDEGELGALRIGKALVVLRKTDVAVVVIDGNIGIRPEDRVILERIKERNIPFIIAVNKTDLNMNISFSNEYGDCIYVSALTGEGVNELKEKIASLAKENEAEKPIASDLVNPLEMVILVVPIDKAAPKGRLILPQQQVIRDLLDHGSVPVVCGVNELSNVLSTLGESAKLVITDSQAFAEVSKIVPDNIPLTSFSILFSRYKGELDFQKKSLEALVSLKQGDKILIAEGCTHHRQCGDIGTEKIPKMIKKICGFDPVFETTSGAEFPDDLSRYKLIVHCGGCMLNEKEMKARIAMAKNSGVPITNYGMVIAFATGILERSINSIEIAKSRVLND